MKRLICCIVSIALSLILAKPMESIERYNIILVHGAASSGRVKNARTWRAL